MKKLKLFFALFAMLALGVGNAWAEDVTFSWSGSATADAGKTDYVVEQTPVTLTFAAGTAQNAPRTNKEGSVRMYANTTLTISCASGNITKVTFTSTQTSYNATKLKYNGTALTSDEWTLSSPSNEVTLTASANARFKTIVVTYTSAGSGETPEPDPDPTPDPEPEPDPDPAPGTGGTGTINFNSSAVKINAPSVTGNDDLGNTWTITTVGTTSYTASNAYYQVGSGSKPATSITFTTTLPSDVNVTAFSAKFGGFNSTAGAVTLKVDDTSVGTGSLNATSDVTISNSSQATGKKLTVTLTGIAKGVKVYYISYTYTTSSGGSEPETPATELTDDQFAWSAATAEATMGASNTFPTLTNTLPVSVTYESSNTAAATIAADGTITLVAPGTTTISAKFAGGEVNGTTYAPKTVTYALTVLKAPATPTDNVYVKVTSTAGITDGEYLIVYEAGNVAFNGALEALDAVGNTLEVTINNNTIAGTNYIDAATFTIDVTNGTILSASGKYIGKTANSNGLEVKTTAMTNTFAIDANGNAVITGNTAALRYNKAADQKRFRYYKDGGGSQEKIALYKKASKQTVTIATCTNGSVSAKMGETALATNDQVLSGITITLDNEPATGHKLAVYDVYKTDDNTTKVTVTDDTFIMPEFDVTISATFVLAKTLTSIEITSAATQTTFWQGETFNHNGLKVTAHFDGADDEDVTDKVTVTGSTATASTQTVTVSFTEGEVTKEVTYTITVKAIPNTKETAYTVADAFDIIDKLTTANGVFIKGIVSQVDSYNSTYKSITYWISDDGTTTKQLQAYSGKGLDEAEFSDINGVSKADQVIVCGNLKKHTDGTYEFNYNNYLVSQIKTTKADPELSYTTTEYNVNLGDAFAAPTLNNPHTLAVTYGSNNEDVATVAVDGAVTIKAAGTVTITASFAGSDDYVAGEASYTIKVMGIASLPFAFDGKCADIANTAGMSQEGIDLDDYASSPHLKINTTGDYLTIHFDSEPDKLTYDIKGNSFSGGTFTVQESADGETYTTIATYTELGEKVSEEKELESTSRYVKFIYTKKVNGNVALGNISITKPDTRKDAGLAWSEETVILTVGDAFTAPTLSNPYTVSGINYESSNDEVATVTTEGVIALGSATGTATITATFAGDVTYKPATATCVVIVNEYVEMVLGVWQLVKDAAALKAGDKVIVASADAVDGKYYALSTTQNKNNRGQADVNKIEENVTFSTDVQVLTLEVGVEENTFAFNTGSGYLYAASSSANHLKTQEDLDANGSWTISIDANTGVATVKAQGGNTHNLMQYNKSSKLFSSYDNPQQGIALYKKMPDYTREVDPQYYGTICLPKAGKFVGGSLYEVAYYDETTKKVYFDEVLNGEMEAGMPYIFLANATMIEAYYTNDEEAAAKHKNGLYGTLVDITSGMNEDGVYMIYRNQIIHSTNSGSYLNANRAYIKFTEELPGYNDPSYVAQAPAPGRKRIAMGTTGQNTATGVDQVQGDNVPTKMIINGQLFILRGEKMYDAQGKLVK